ncbi:hypothetical protein GUJ93_ZPchr0013g36966 [Zizania palustris]|uniref:Uncharacterized protein n=1 Tax=Zizania palustris TaxID=103762 RepID=A0A8J6C1H1_ZIZPA|nr:hypothetical protein GUJ93_ZPchr0013g36966 [Zizania palustris]
MVVLPRAAATVLCLLLQAKQPRLVVCGCRRRRATAAMWAMESGEERLGVGRQRRDLAEKRVAGGRKRRMRWRSRRSMSSPWRLRPGAPWSKRQCPGTPRRGRGSSPFPPLLPVKEAQCTLASRAGWLKAWSLGQGLDGANHQRRGAYLEVEAGVERGETEPLGSIGGGGNGTAERQGPGPRRAGGVSSPSSWPRKTETKAERCLEKSSLCNSGGENGQSLC